MVRKKSHKFSEMVSRILPIILALSVIVSIGVIGYCVIEHYSFIDSLYMTIITITTVGFGEVKPLSFYGKIFTIFIILAGGVLAYFIFTLIAQFIIEGTLKNIFGRRKMEKTIRRLKDHYIVCGYGRMGRSVCEEFSKREVPFVVIENNEKNIEELNSRKYHYIKGDATEEEILEKAGIKKARGVICVVSSDSDNVYISLTARGLNNKLLIVARAEREAARNKLLMAGADKVIMPYHLSGRRIAMAVLKPDVVEFIDIATGVQSFDLVIDQIYISQDSSLVNCKIGKSNIRMMEMIIVGVKKKNKNFIYNPSPDYTIEAGDTLIVIGKKQVVERFKHSS